MSDRKEPGGFLNRWSSRKQQSAERLANADSPLEKMSRSRLPESADRTPLHCDELWKNDFSSNDLKSFDASPDDTRNSETGNGKQCEGVAPVAAAPVAAAPVAEATALRTDADMPDIESLTSSSDISGFLGKGVSAALRRAALRHVFRQPAYNVRDGLDDYDDDYTTFEPLGNTVTSDMKFHAARKEQARLSSQRLSAEPIQAEPDASVRADAAQDSTLTDDSEQADRPVEGQADTNEEGTLDHVQERHESALATEQDDNEHPANLSHASLPDHRPDTDKPLKKTLQVIASQPNEISDE